MTQNERDKWAKRSEIKTYQLAGGVKHLSGKALNLSANLPADAVWREENFA